MIQPSLAEAQEVTNATHYAPAISIIQPFEPKMSSKNELNHRLQLALTEVRKQLKKNYAADTVTLVNEKLNELLNTIDYASFKKSIALYASPVFQKIYYLDIAVEEKIIIDDSFEIRDLIYAKKDLHKYLILVLSEHEYRFIVGNTTQFIHIISNGAGKGTTPVRDLPEKVGNFSDSSHEKEIELHKFLQLTDHCLGRVLASWDLPLFVIGPERVTGHFKKISHHHNRVISYITGSFEKAGAHEIGKVLQPYVANWRRVCQQNVVQKLEVAVNENKLSAGVHNVWRDAQHKNGRLLVVEKNYMYAAVKDAGMEDMIQPHEESDTAPFYIKDAVDDIIEKVLENGGDVEFVDEGLLTPYQQIALIRFF
jgi:hypothetical protein